MLSFKSNRVVAIGEAMIEMAVVGPETYRRSFAGDTFNTAWHMAQLGGLHLDVGLLTKVGSDTVSDSFVKMLRDDGIDTTKVSRDPDRTMGLYMIELNKGERSFSYWRDASAARRLADDVAWLKQAVDGSGLIHLSGITLGILDAHARDQLFAVLAAARKAGARICFDPNVRLKIWHSLDEAREVMTNAFSIADIALPSFDDEANLWGDQSPDHTINRIGNLGVTEIVVKNGAGQVRINTDGGRDIPTQAASDVRDTSGAGDAFNAGYLAARLSGMRPAESVGCGQALALEVIRHFGARIPKSSMPKLPFDTLRR